ncbi:MAG: hypothetical protein U0528_10010 [Anaerolineae bacterium]|nr:hypothetical protein [Anaerolineae bacterium]
MRLIIRLATALCTIFSLCATTLVWGGKTTESSFARLFTFPDGTSCTDCLFGIMPGQTDFNAAADLLLHHPLTNTLVPLNITDPNVRSFAGSDLLITLHGRKNGVITDVMIFFANNDLTLPASNIGSIRLADVWLALHAPTRISIGTDPLRVSSSPRNYATWRYESSKLLIVARLRTGRMNASATLSHIHLSVASDLLGIYNPLNYAARVTLSYDSANWFGFVNVRAYMNDAILSKGRGVGVKQALN